MLSWIVAGFAILVAIAALASVRRLARKVEALNQSYWELRYEHSRLRAQVARLDPEQQTADDQQPPSAGPAVAFVPLSSLKKQ